jgi:phosphoribosylanthranilate isomerase
MNKLIIKVCGINEMVNHEAITTLPIDMIGLNFYAPSKRYLTMSFIPNRDIDYVGVFVKSDKEYIHQMTRRFNLKYAQLHGDETPDFCASVGQVLPVIKAFRVDETFDFSETEAFESCEYFLFDTKTADFGGSGKKFDWSKLQNYRGNVPFLLSGGIGPEDAAALLAIRHPMFKGIDINSRFELSPGIKDVEQVFQFLQQLNYESVQISS